LNIMRFVIMFILLVIVYGGSHFYTAQRLYQWLNLIIPNINLKIYIIIFTIPALSMFLRFIPLPFVLKSIFNYISAYWLGVFVYLFAFTLAADLIILLLNLIKIIPTPLPQKVLFCKGLIALLLTTCIVSFGLFNANRIKNVSYNIKIEKPSLQSEIKIAVISDLHLGSVQSESNIAKIVQGINDSKQDIICIVGDIFNDDFKMIKNPAKAADLFKSLKSTYGVYACLGNHDAGKTLNEMINFLEQSNIKLLNDEYTIIDNRLVLAGRLDSSPIGGFGSMKRIDTKIFMSSINTELPVVVMDHNPSNIHQYGNETDLIISGHTHRGQIFPGNIMTNAIFTIDYGHYQKDANSPHVIVTSGAGTWGTPMRVGTNNEIANIILCGSN